MRAWVLVALGATLCASRGEALDESATTLAAAVLPAETSVGRDEPVAGSAVIHLQAARGEREPALVAVRATRDGLLTARVTALYSRDGAALASSAVELDRVAWVPHGEGEIADRLEPLQSAEPVSAAENLLLWVEVAVPHSAAPGFYRGSLELTEGRATRTVPIDLQILPFALPARPSLATSLDPGAQSGSFGAYAHLALQERVTYRAVTAPPFQVKPLEGTLLLDFSAFDRELGPLLQGASRPSSIAIEIPRAVPAPRKLEYLLAVKHHLAERGIGELLVTFGEDDSLLRHLQGAPDAPAVALVTARDDGPRRGAFWWRLGGPATSGALSSAGAPVTVPPDDSGTWLALGAKPWQVRSIGWAAFHAGAVGLYGAEVSPLLYEAADGAPRESVRLKLLRQGIEDYEFLQLAAKVDPLRAHEIAERVLGEDGGPARSPADFEAARGELIHLIEARHSGRVVRVP